MPRPCPLALDLFRRGPFDVQLTIAKRLLGLDVVALGDGIPFLIDPFVGVVPLREILAAEEHDRVAGRTADRAGIDDRRLAPRNAADPFTRVKDKANKATKNAPPMVTAAAIRRRFDVAGLSRTVVLMTLISW